MADERTPTDPLAAIIDAHRWRPGSGCGDACQWLPSDPAALTEPQHAAHVAAVVRASGTTTTEGHTFTASDDPEAQHICVRDPDGMSVCGEPPDHPIHAASGVPLGGTTREKIAATLRGHAATSNLWRCACGDLLPAPPRGTAVSAADLMRDHQADALMAALRPVPAPDDLP